MDKTLKEEIETLEKLLSEKVINRAVEDYEDYKKIKGASEEELIRLEESLGIKLPQDFIDFYKYKDGSGELTIFWPSIEGYTNDFFCGSLFSIEEIVDEKKRSDWERPMIPDGFYTEEDIAKLDPRIKPFFMNKKWIPLGGLKGFSFRLYLDYDPTPEGKEGQVIAYVHDPDFIYYLAEDFSEFLKKSNENLSTLKEIT